jgi:2,4-dienoyl-CoA reductase-like NADH-dependent reductase (Old Yellow Enzyme family)
MAKELNDTITFSCGASMKNRFMLAPLTNCQSYEDGTLSETEFNWLTLRAKGGFGLVMTCASHVQANGKGFPGQLGIFNDTQIKGHTRLATAIKKEGSLAVVQLHHAGMRAPENLIHEQPVCPSNNEKTNARALTVDEVVTLRNDFIAAAIRAQKAGYDGVEIHAAHGYILCQFLSTEFNKRNDAYGGTLEHRSRIIFEIIEGIRAHCGKQFLIGIRLSPERFGMDLQEVKTLAQQLIDTNHIDFLDLSLWDCFKYPEDTANQDQSLLDHFTSLHLKGVKLTVAGKISTGNDVSTILKNSVDFVTIGRSGILHHDFPLKVLANANFVPKALPVTPEYLQQEGLSPTFIEYMKRWPGFVVPTE